MSAAGIKIATITPNALTAAALDESGVSNNRIANANGTDCAQRSINEKENSSFCNLPSLKEVQSSLFNEIQNKKVPLENSKKSFERRPDNEAENIITSASSGDFNEIASEYIRQEDIENVSVSQLSPGLSLLQQTATSSPPPHSYRHSRAYRHFKNPPQPHMCIRTTTEAGEELFINVLSWTRIVIPQEPSDPIPLYGGMRVPPGSPRSPPIVFAVMANPEVLKDSGRHSKDHEERRAMIELMCDFVEAMNPGVKLVRNAIILKDRDISGELKDVWNAVQAQRDREREEQMLLQRQQHQQHFHNISNGSAVSNSLSSGNNSVNIAVSSREQVFSTSMASGSGEEALITTVDDGTPLRSRKNIQQVQNDNNSSNVNVERHVEMIRTNNYQESLALLAEHLDNKTPIVCGEKSDEFSTKHQNSQKTLTNDALSNGNNSRDTLETERSGKTIITNQLNAINCNNDVKKEQLTLINGTVANSNNIELTNIPKSIDASVTPNAAMSIPAQNLPTSIAPLPTVQQAPIKKEKLGGFLPNGCIFPRFTKNNKHKDKDKEPKTKEKEKNALLSALKKSKDKKSNAAVTSAANSNEKITSSNSKITANNSNIKQQKNCLQQLETGVQKLDLSHHHTNVAENNINNSDANNIIETNKNTSSTISNSDRVGVH